MPVDIDIHYVARLARLALSDDELARYGRQLEGILEHAALVQSLATDGVEPTSHPLSMTNAFRPDEITPSLDRDEVLSQAPETQDGYFRVPRILEES
ncbi:MAG: Asp-tRNA(Asn)/Glu-tRNA(Gln) amidotransferase subunit GatC [Acidimicrobiia bacterium]|nr:Asp-tRNA(Asn)/Glu-tRNA(Gln) amidotransferase subunit GatC [Acidimicrobiia bacterium]MDH3469713.1 Asp-tRNA(Asn)/Glu-tRNA(Gln) amidotransferase subunit GatC [Acidimicrobiia bacterium]